MAPYAKISIINSMVTNLLYSLKVWLTSVLLSPVLYIVLIVIKNFDVSLRLYSFGSTYILLVLFSFLFSFLTWFVFFLIIMVISNYACSETIARVIICITGMTMTAATFRLTIFQNGFTISDIYIYLMFANCFCIGAGSWIYKFRLFTHPALKAPLPHEF